jgi:cytochrome c
MFAKKFSFITISFLLLVSSYAFADDVAKGKSLFNDPKLAGATRGKSCGSCHSESSAAKWVGKKDFSIMGKKAKSLEEAVNICIENAMGGKAIDPKGADMKAIVAYIKSLAKK